MKYSKEKVKEITDLLASGMSRADSMTLADISLETFHQWINSKPEFAESIKKAELICKQRNVVRIQKASKKNWTAAAWWLERKFPEDFAERQKHEFSGPNGLPLAAAIVNVDLSRLSDDDLKKLSDSLDRNAPGK